MIRRSKKHERTIIISQKDRILEYLENAFVGAKAADDAEMMLRLSRAIVAFSYNNMSEESPDLDKMIQEYLENQYKKNKG